ncbi:GapA-binding peptide SR1P [Ectobacillus funiculus]
MGTILCQVCGGTIEQFEDEKVTVLYGHCCSSCKKEIKSVSLPSRHRLVEWRICFLILNLVYKPFCIVEYKCYFMNEL